MRQNNKKCNVPKFSSVVLVIRWFLLSGFYGSVPRQTTRVPKRTTSVPTAYQQCTVPQHNNSVPPEEVCWPWQQCHGAPKPIQRRRHSNPEDVPLAYVINNIPLAYQPHTTSAPRHTTSVPTAYQKHTNSVLQHSKPTMNTHLVLQGIIQSYTFLVARDTNCTYVTKRVSPWCSPQQEECDVGVVERNEPPPKLPQRDHLQAKLHKKFFPAYYFNMLCLFHY